MARHCKECGTALAANADYRAEFCAPACRKAFNNRRMTRGAELYDLFMACRHERGVAKVAGYWNLMCRMAAAWKAEDVAERQGRRSYHYDPKVLGERYVRYSATHLR